MFRFGRNWKNFLKKVNQSSIERACFSLREMLQVDSLEGKSFLDIGSGSGLTSLAARKMGANVISFDYDEESVFCTNKLKEKFYPKDKSWEVIQGSVLDDQFMDNFYDFDYVVSWGVLHHTGNMWKAIENVYHIPKKNNGILYIALYNDQGLISKYWSHVKRLYNTNIVAKWLILIIHFPTIILLPYLIRKIQRRDISTRGMSLWYDLHDWVGGYPFEVASKSDVKEYFSRDYSLIKIIDVGRRHGCNEFVFKRKLNS